MQEAETNKNGEIATNIFIDGDKTNLRIHETDWTKTPLGALAVGKNFQEILDSITETVEKIFSGSRSSILLADAAEKRLFSGSAKSLPAEYNAAIEGIYIAEGVGSCGTAAFRRAPVIVSDIARDPLWKDYSKLAASYELAACWSHPILAPDGKLLGTFGTYFSKPREPNEAEISVLESAAQIAGIAIYRKLTEDALQKSEAHLAAIFAEAHVGLSEISDNGRFLRVNNEFCRILARSREELLKLEVTDVILPEDLQENTSNLRKLRENGGLLSFDSRFQRPNGETIWTNNTISLLENGQNNPTILAVAADLTERKQSESRMTLLSEIGDLTRENETAEDLLFAVAETVGRHFEARRCLFNEIDLENDLEIVHYDYCRGVESVAGRHKISDYSPITSGEMTAGRIVVNRDSKNDPRTAAFYEKIYAKSGERAYVAVPLMRQNSWVASLWISDDKPRNWSAEEITLLQTIGERVWSVVEKLRIDAALRESEERFRNMADNAPVMVWVTDAAGFCTYLSQSWYEFTGQTPETGLGFGWLDATHPDDQKRAEETFLESNKNYEDFKIEYRLRCKDGQFRWSIDSAKPRFDAKGEFLGYIGSVTDIHERKQIEEQIKYQLNLTKTITDNTQSCLMMMDADGRCTFANHATERITGFEPDEVIGEILHEKIHHMRPNGAPYPKADCPLGNALALNETLVGYEENFIHKQGYFYPVRCSTRPIFKNGETTGMILEFQDITEEKRIAEERERLLLSERIAREEAENANRLKDEFLATVSHELRTPLNAILGWATMARKEPESLETMNRAMEVIERSARNQNQIISDILDVSRIITGKLHLNLEPVRLSLIVNAAIDTMRPSLEAKWIHLEKDFETENEIEIAGDADRLQQVVWNVLSNAVKFTHEGGEINVSLRYTSNFAEIIIKDNGEGIPPDFIPFVFDRFRQADGRWNRKHGGLGLGLAVVRHLTELHGGTASVESTGLGHGASFTIRLPIRKYISALVTNSNLISNNQVFLNEKAEPHRILQGLTILAVDDQPDALELVKYILIQQGAVVLTAQSVDAALEIFDRQTVNMVISDIGMPDRDGYELMSELLVRFSRSNLKIPAIALTAYAGEKDNERVLLAGFQAFLPKPVEPAELVKTIAALTSRS